MSALWLPLWQNLTWIIFVTTFGTACFASNMYFLRKKHPSAREIWWWRFLSFQFFRVVLALSWSALLFLSWPREYPEIFAIVSLFVVGSMLINSILAVGLLSLILIEILPRVFTFLASAGYILLITEPSERFAILCYVLMLFTFMMTILTAQLSIGLHKTTLRQTEQKYQFEHAKIKAEQANIAKSTFMSIMSHEIKTPLNGILTISNLLHQTNSKETQAKYLDAISESSKTLMALLSDVLDLSLLETGTVVPKKSPTDLHKLINATIMVMKSHAEAKDLALFSNLAPDLPRFIICDPSRLRQVLINLIGNAIRYTQAGHIRLDVEVQKNIQNSGPKAVTLKFSLHDTGPGIKPENLENLFEKFTQFDTSNQFEGAGLGLAICREILAAMNGKIGVESELAVGSTFWFDVPVELTSEQEYLTNEEKEHFIPELPPLKILVVEDNAINQMVLVDLLRNDGHHPVVAENGIECLKFLKKKKFDIILMDVRMPKMDGIETTRKIRAMAKPVCDIPIIALSAQLSPEEKKHCQNAKMNGQLLKPIEVSHLFREIARHCPGQKNNKIQGTNTEIKTAKSIEPVTQPATTSIKMTSPSTGNGFDHHQNKKYSTLDELRRVNGEQYVKNLVKDTLNDIEKKLKKMKRLKNPGKLGDEAHQILGLARLLNLEQTITLINQFQHAILHDDKTETQKKLKQMQHSFLEERKTSKEYFSL